MTLSSKLNSRDAQSVSFSNPCVSTILLKLSKSDTPPGVFEAILFPSSACTPLKSNENPPPSIFIPIRSNIGCKRIISKLLKNESAMVL